jgi:hypothetical protein
LKSLLNSAEREAMSRRLDSLSPDAERRWGRMSVDGMLCHLSDAFQVVLGEREAERLDHLVNRTIVKWLAIDLPLPWPKGVPTAASCDQERDGTPPGDFEGDKARLLAAFERFMERIESGTLMHPVFGDMSAGAWGRWGYRHMDHHLRQFGV